MARSVCVAAAVLLALCFSAHALVPPPPYSPPPYSPDSPYSGGGGGELPPVMADKALFDDFALTYGRTYTADEKDQRFECFRTNLRLIEERNAKGKGEERHGINQFADVCPEEFKARVLTYRPERNATDEAPMKTVGNVQASCQAIDWRTKGAVTPVSNQGQCGDCWAWSTVENIEGVIAASGKPLVALSVQELVDCTTNSGNNGCNGGMLTNTYQWIIDNGGIDSAADYPYRAQQGTCNPQKVKKHVAKIAGYVNITQSEAAIASYLCEHGPAIASYLCEHGPVNVAVDASSWQTYTGGVMTSCTFSYLDFSAVIVGLNLTASPPYWIVKGTWGASFGENGYLRIAYGTNQCGINQMAVSATL